MEKGPKVYCDRCDTVFNSRPEYESHLGRHSGVPCEACPIDTALSRVARLFRRATSKNLE